MEIKDLLENIGLTKNESSIYLAVIELGECTSGDIIKRANIKTGRIYDIINALIYKGLVSFIIKNNVKHFIAAEPTRLMDYLKAREKEHMKIEIALENALPEIVLKKRMAEKKTRVEVYEGLEGIKTALTVSIGDLKKGDETQIMGTPKNMLELLGPFLTSYHKKRIARGILARFLYHSDMISSANIRSRWKLSKARILPPEIKDPVYIYVSGNYVVTGLVTEDFITILMKNDEIAKGYRTYFDFLWEKSLTLSQYSRNK